MNCCKRAVFTHGYITASSRADCCFEWMNCKILSIETDINNQNVLTCGNDNTIRQWTMDTLDQKFSLYKIDETPSKLILNNKENILLSLYENSFIRVYNMSNLKSLGLIQIPNEDISQFDLCLNNNGIILTTNHDKIYLIQIQNWQPLSLLYTDLTNNLISLLSISGVTLISFI